MTPYRHHLSAALIIDRATKSLRLPKGRWTAAEFWRQRRQLQLALHRIAWVSQAKARAEIARLMNAMFKRQIERVVWLATAGTVQPGKSWESLGAKGPPAFMANLPASGVQSMDVWERAIQEVFGREATVDTVLQIMKPIRSVLDQGLSRTATVMRNTRAPRPAVNPQLQRDAEQIAARVTHIPDTTRRQLRNEIRRSIDEGETVVETAKRVLDVMPKRDEARALTIARTETNNAYTRGAITAYEENGDVLTVCVIGCSQIEQTWTWHDMPTCNITGVPVANAQELEWHPNHVGTLVAETFRE